VQSDNSGKAFGLATTDLDAVVIPRVRRWKDGDDPVNLEPIGDFQLNILAGSPTSAP
jgi:hypothetical protein